MEADSREEAETFIPQIRIFSVEGAMCGYEVGGDCSLMTVLEGVRVLSVFFNAKVMMLSCVIFSLCVSDPRGQENDSAVAPQDRKMTALRIDGEITLDGVLDEPEWNQAEPAKDFIQKLPATAEPATETTEVRLLYDQV
ncbi:MAG TPA: hypothetical protein VMY18_09305, partial [Acidobacteriota bacterium]|nr:hypothetical protein [Acidobacteriota bacterium]